MMPSMINTSITAEPLSARRVPDGLEKSFMMIWVFAAQLQK
jgi:hypothetical protein